MSPVIPIVLAVVNASAFDAVPLKVPVNKLDDTELALILVADIVEALKVFTAVIFLAFKLTSKLAPVYGT